MVHSCPSQRYSHSTEVFLISATIILPVRPLSARAMSDYSSHAAPITYRRLRLIWVHNLLKLSSEAVPLICRRLRARLDYTACRAHHLKLLKSLTAVSVFALTTPLPRLSTRKMKLGRCLCLRTILKVLATFFLLLHPSSHQSNYSILSLHPHINQRDNIIVTMQCR